MPEVAGAHRSIREIREQTVDAEAEELQVFLRGVFAVVAAQVLPLVTERPGANEKPGIMRAPMPWTAGNLKFDVAQRLAQ